MKKYIIRGTIIILIIGLVLLKVDYKIFKKKQSNQIYDLININDMSQKDMDNYFEEVSNIKEEDKDNILIVISKDKVTDKDAKKIISAPNNQYYLIYKDEKTKEKAKIKLQENKSTLSVEENVTRTISSTSSYNSWGIEATKLNEAIAVTNERDLGNVTAVVLDSGLDVDLFNKYYSGKLAGYYNVFKNSTTEMSDENGHGTHVAGTIAEGTPDNVKIFVVKAGNARGSFSTLDIITGINYVTYTEKADVINMSFGGKDYTQAEEQAIQAATENNIVSVAAAGNNNTPTPFYPAGFDNTISIASVDSNLNKSDFSNYGSKITFTAPGSNINSLVKNGNVDADHGIKSGTSMATPHAVAAVAILKSYNKNITLENTIELLKKHAVDLGDPGWDQYFGYGLISFENAIFCNNKNCDKYNVFTENDISNDIYKKLELNSVQLTSYNYGSLTNILGTTVKATYEDNSTEIIELGNLTDVEITNYDPYKTTSQNVIVKYNTTEGEKQLQITITNPSSYEIGWTYNIVSEQDKTMELKGYKDHNLNISKLYVPETIKGYNVIGFANTTSTTIFANSNDLINYKYLHLPSTMQYIGTNSLKDTPFETIEGDCSDIKVLANGLKNSSLNKISIPISELGESAFENSEYLKKINISKKLTIIPNNAFKKAKRLQKVIQEDNTWIETIGNSAFEDCYNLFDFDISLVGTIGDKAFMYCNNYRNIDIVNAESIGEYAFAYTNINSVEFSSQIDTIKDSAFYHCSNLTNLELTYVETIEANAFSYTNISVLDIPASVKSIADNSFNFTPLTNIIVSPNNKYYNSGNGSKAIIETSTNKLVKGSSKTVIPNTVKEIGRYAFMGNSQLEEIKIPEGVTKINNMAFNSCNFLDTIIMPSNNIAIGLYAFDRTWGNTSAVQVTMYVYHNSSSYQYAINRNIEYRYIDPSEIIVDYEKNEFKVNETVDYRKVTITLKYDEQVERTEVQNYAQELVYQNGYSFKYGDTYYIVKGTNAVGYKYEKNVPVTVSKLTPTYDIPKNITADEGQKLSEISLPTGYEWMNPNEVVSKDKTTYKARYTPTDTDNYETVENIDIELIVKSPEIIPKAELTATPSSINYGEVYQDFNNHIRKTVRIKNTGNVAVSLSLNNPVSDGPFGSMNFQNGIVILPNEEYTITLVTNPNGTNHNVPGTYNGTYVITGTDVDDINRKTTVNINASLVIKKLPPTVSYTTHVQNIGWQNYVKNGAMAGTSGKSLRLEAIKIKLENQDYAGDVLYKTHIENDGWESSYKRGSLEEKSGTSGRALRLEAIEIKLDGEMAEHYDVYYRVHAQNFGWLGWAKNGEDAGSAGYSYRLEGIEIKLIEKNQEFSEYGKQEAFKGKVMYTTHVQYVGWQNYVKDGEMAGTSGQSLRLEGIKIKTNVNAYKGDIEYRTHVQNIGWQDYVKNGAMAGTSGQSLRLEAINIRLTNELAEHYDIYYRVHAQNLGWLGWAKNDEPAGSAGFAYRLEGIEIQMIEKGKTFKEYGQKEAFKEK